MQCLYQLKLKQSQATFGSHTSKSFKDSQVFDREHHIVKIGHFFRNCDQALIQRYLCRTCRKSFSQETIHPCVYQKKRHLNSSVFNLLVSGVSQRRAARLLQVNPKTIVRKFLFLGQFSLAELRNKTHLQNKHIKAMQFDDMETFEHSKCKPLSITLAVEEKTRFILGFRVASMPAKGLLAKTARAKYGYRKDERAKFRRKLFRELQSHISAEATIKSDMNPHYKEDVRRYFQTQAYFTYKGRRGCVVGQGELKSGGFDPLFSLNHTAAMLRANINRLFRRTWCTTKKAICLEYHIALYCFYHNFVLLPNTQPSSD